MEPEELGSMSYIWIFSAVAFFMLLIACINYMNLTTARSARRAKEIGIRKVTGSTKKQLVAAVFRRESYLPRFRSVLLSVLLVILLLPVFNSIRVKHLLSATCCSLQILCCCSVLFYLPVWWAAVILHFICQDLSR